MENAVSLGKENFSHQKSKFITEYRINEKGVLSSEEAYRSLKRYFLAKGMYNDASWASFKEKTMERKLLKKRKDITYIPSLIMNLLCGYGEKPYRIAISSFGIILFYAFLYNITDAIRYTKEEAYRLAFADHIYYSVITFTTVGYGDFVPKAVAYFRLLAASEAFIGIFIMGLFIFTLSRKYAAR
jgi:hypothetical protein